MPKNYPAHIIIMTKAPDCENPQAINSQSNDNNQNPCNIAIIMAWIIGVIIAMSFIGFVISGIVAGAFSEPLETHKRMIIAMNNTGAYVGFDKCTGDIFNCTIEKYLIVDNPAIYNQDNIYCLEPMDQPIKYQIKDQIIVSYNQELLDKRIVLYGCNDYFYPYGSYMMYLTFYFFAICFIGSMSIVAIIGCMIAMTGLSKANREN